MARFSTAQQDVLVKMAKEGKLTTSQWKNISDNAKELRNLSEGGSVGFAKGGMPKAPGAAPTPVQDPGEFTQEDPGKFIHYKNYHSGNSFRAGLRNQKTGAMKYTGYVKKDDHKAVNALARTMLADLNKPYNQYKKDKKAHTDKTNKYKAYTKSKSAYDKKAKAYQDANLKGQQELVQKSIQDPSSLVTKQQVSAINPKTAGTTISGSTGQVGGKVPQVGVTTGGKASTASTPKPITAQTYSADMSQKDTEKALKGFEGETGKVSRGAQVGEIEGDLSRGATAKGQKFDKKFLDDVQAGKRKVTRQEIVNYAKANNIPESEAATMLAPKDVDAAEFTGDTLEATAQDSYDVPATQIAKQDATKVEDAAKASEIPEAEVAQSNFQSTIQAAEGRVGGDELVNASDIVGAEQSVTATAATLEALNEESKVNAAKGSFSQAALAVAQTGRVSPSATVQGQMEKLMQQFNDGTPAWAAGAMRAANAAMSARGLGASSMAGAAILQAAMESSIPIAQQDAQAFQQMEMANMSNQQQVSLANAAAQQNIELANLNNEQQAALQNSANTFQLQAQNLSNEQAVVLANAQMKSALQGKTIDVKTQTALTNAAKYTEINKINLTNEQQTRLQKSAENLQVDLANLNSTQQTALSNLQVRAALVGQELSNEQQMAMLESTQSFERANFDASAKQQAFLQDAQAAAALEGRAMDARQQTQLFNVSNILEERKIELSNEQQTTLFNATNKIQVDMAKMSNRQQTALANAQIEAAMRGQELNNKQQSAVLNAEKFAEAANLTFSAQEQAKLANSQMMQTVGLAEMSNRQAAALQNAAQVAGMDMANASFAQQAAIQNAQSFLQMDMANLSNDQQAAMFKAQSIQQSILSDQAAENAERQFNASSKNQTNQFMANMKNQTSQFNASQNNAMKQFNAGQKNSVNQFNASIKEQRNQFNATNKLVVAQANAQWKQNVATLNTAAKNQANAANALAANNFTQDTMDQIWQRERDVMDYAFKANEDEKDRVLSVLLADKQYDEYAKARKESEETYKWATAADIIFG